MAVSDDLEPSDETLVVITATRDGEVVVYPDEEHDDEVAVFLDGDPEIPELLEAARKVYGPSARVMPLDEFKKLAGDSA